MNFLKKYSKFSRISHTSIRTFAYNAKPYNAPIGSGTRNTAYASEPTNAGIGIRSASRDPEHITSTDTRFNSFNASGPTSGFSASGSQDLASSSKNFADSTASSLKNLADQAANTAKGFVDQTQGFASGNTNRTRSPIDDLVNTANSVAQGVGDLAQGAISAAASFGTNFIPRDQVNQQSVNDRSQRPAYYDQHDYDRDNALRNTGSYGSRDSRYTSYDTSYNPTHEIGKFVDSTARNFQDATNQVADRARSTFDQVTGNNFATSQVDPSNTINSTLSQAQAFAGTAANLAGYAVKGMMDNAAYFASAFAPTSISSSSPTQAYSRTERSAAFNSQQTNNYGYVYNPGFTSTENKRVEHIMSTDTRFNAFSSAGHVSGFGAPLVSAQEFGSSAKRFADDAASNFKGAVDQAADTAKDFVDRGSNYMNSTGNPAVDLVNQAASTAQAIAGQTAYMIGSTLNSFVNLASSTANQFAAPSQQQQNRAYGQDQNYMNSDYERRPQNFTSTDTRSNFFNPGQGSGSHPVSPFDNPIGSFVSSFASGNPVTSMIQGAVNTGFALASNFVPGSQNQNPNFFRQNQYSGSQDRPSGNFAEDTLKGAANVAQGLVNTAANVASAFIPGAGQNRNPSQR